MSNDQLQTSPFEQTVLLLEEGLEQYRTDTSDTLIRDGLICRFKCTYELGHRILRRYLEWASASPEQTDQLTFREIVRTAKAHGLLMGDWLEWRVYRCVRKNIANAYEENVALEIIENIPGFLKEAIHMRDRLRDRPA